MQKETITHYLRSGNEQSYCGQPAQGLRAYHFLQRPEWQYFQHACLDCKAEATKKVFQQKDAPAKPVSQALLDQFRHANTDRVVCALDALQQHSMAVALLYTSATTITAEVTSVKIKRNRKKETRIERNTYTTCVSAVGCSCTCPDSLYRDIAACKHSIAAAVVADEARRPAALNGVVSTAQSQAVS